MKRFLVFLLGLFTLLGLYNASIVQHSVRGFFGDRSYENGEFQDAERRYARITENGSGGTLQEADTLYNLGNTLYRIAEQTPDTSKKIRLYRKAVASYTKSLSIRVDRATEENLAFVKEKLRKEEEKKKQEEKKEQEKQTGSGAEDTPRTESGSTKEGQESGSGKENKPGQGAGWQESGSGKSQDQNGAESQSGSENKPKNGNWSNGGSYNPVGGKDDTEDSTLSDQDRQEVEKYLKELKEFARQNGKLLNPEKPGAGGSLSDQIRNFFGNDSFFQDVIPTNDGKKDW